MVKVDQLLWQAPYWAMPVPVPSEHSSVKMGRNNNNNKLPTFEELRSDKKIQGEIPRKLHQYNNLSCQELGKATDVIKSGHYRPGVYKVKRQIIWPPDFCVFCSGTKQPTYNKLTVLQWSPPGTASSGKAGSCFLVVAWPAVYSTEP